MVVADARKSGSAANRWISSLRRFYDVQSAFQFATWSNRFKAGFGFSEV
jgi:hypothetical protein